MESLWLSGGFSDSEVIAEAARSGCVLAGLAPGLFRTEFLPTTGALRIAASRQFLPRAQDCRCPSVSSWGERLFETICSELPAEGDWQLHVEPHYGIKAESKIGARARHSDILKGKAWRAHEVSGIQPHAGQIRCKLIREGVLKLLQRHRRDAIRRLQREPRAFSGTDTLVQLLLTSHQTGWLSASPQPGPFQYRHWISPFPKGEVAVPNDKSAPSRAFAKLVEAELRFGRRIRSGEVCVDLGASPGGWTWVARQRGARVIAVDRSPLRDDLMNDPAVAFVRGDAFSYEPSQPVDWFVCDVIAAPERSIELVLEWARRRWMRHFVVTIKLRVGDHPKLDRLKAELPAWSDDWYLTHLCANKHEACVFGTVREAGPISP
jgi:23S rRNA (cytidine2498-2'-O)-methyltransferase